LRRALNIGLDLLSVIVGGILGIAGGILVAIVLIIGVVWLFTRDPSPEDEVRKVLSAQNVGGFVDVADCRYVAADSVYDQWIYCFRIPRARRT